METERHILYTLLLDTETDTIFKQLEEIHFTDKKYKVVYRAAKDLHDKGTFTVQTLLDSCKDRSTIQALYGSEFGILTGKKLTKAIRFLKDQYTRSSIAYNFDTLSTREIKDLLEASYTSSGEIVTQDTIDNFIAQSLAYDEYKAPFFTSALNRVLGGVSRENLTIVASRPSVGKSVFLEQLFWQYAGLGIKTLFCSLEMSVDMVFKRHILRTLGIDLFKNQKSKEEKAQLFDRCKVDLKDNVISQENTTLEDIESLIKEHKPQVLLVDYLQLIPHENKRLKEYDRVTEVSKELKHMAKKYKIAVVAASQLSRGTGEQPRLSDLRSSGQIEQDADLVLSLWRKVENVTPEGAKVYVDCLKNRNGVTFANSDFWEFALVFKPERVTFYDYERRRGK